MTKVCAARAAGLAAERTWHLAQSGDPIQRRCDVREWLGALPAEDYLRLLLPVSPNIVLCGAMCKADASVLTAIPHCGISHVVVFIESRPFTRRLMDLAGDSADNVLRQIQDDLLQNPARGSIVKGLGGIRKARMSNPTRGKGKRGGYRYLHLYLEHREHIHLIFLLDKGEQEDLSTEQRKELRRMVAELKGL